MFVVLLLAVPSPMVVAPLGTAGAPSTIAALGGFALWAWFHVQRTAPGAVDRQPVRLAALGWLLAILAVYAYAMGSPLPGDEISPADSGLLKAVGLVGLVVLANDGTPTFERHRALVRRLLIGVGLVAVLGVVQYSTKQLFVDRLSIPGLTNGTADWVLSTRSGLIRPSGTATHPIEFGVVLTMVLPLAITFALRSPTRRWLYRLLLAPIALAVFLSISRSAVLCALVALVVLAVRWSARVRLGALVVTLGATAVVYLLVPGVLGTIGRLFTGAGNDPSITSRTDSYQIVETFFERSPVLGRGFGTFLTRYWILDNGYLGLLIEGGVVGLGGLLLLIATTLVAASTARRAAAASFDQEVAHALLAAVAAGACSLAFFDTFAFPQSAGCFFLLIGLVGASRRLALQDATTTRVAAVERRRTEEVVA
ncbi:O-antigen ligase like membrane protein [Microlunatus sagamiharensis]|uniref:O-antigen ligase like membrane protein n=1 Tax=Microlunatus sagamiharensis TaxID=546874 RepID=A0A1H2LTH6_9ACTN|nr:O-antigen ligase like membrane protein [Microlunatus sagamiharensis]